MIRKSNKNLLNWIYEYIIDFTDEKDVSGLTWTSTHDEALKFLHSIPQKERVQRYGFYSSHSTCNIIYNWNLEVGRENWDMIDIKAMSLQEGMEWNSTKQTYVSNPLNRLEELGLVECVNPEVKRGKLYRLTEKGEEIFGDI